MVASLAITSQRPASVAATIDLGDQPPSAVWEQLSHQEGFRTTLVKALAGLRERSDCIPDVYRQLEEEGVTALDGSYTDLCANAVIGDERSSQALSALLEVTSDFGQPNDRRTIIGIGPDASLAAVVDGPLALLRLAASQPVTIVVRATPAFKERRPEHRRTICKLLSDLAEVCTVRIVTDGSTERYLRSEHADDLRGVSWQCSDSLCDNRIETAVENARLALAPSSRSVSVLRTIADDPAEECSYSELVAIEGVTRSRIRQVVNCGTESLAQLRLVETFEGTEGTTVSLLPAGRALVARFDREYGRQSQLTQLTRARGTDADDTPPNPSNHGRVTPAVGIEGESRPGQGLACDSEPATPSPPSNGTSSIDPSSAAEPLSSTDATGYAHGKSFEWSHGPVEVRTLSRREYASAVAGAEDQGIGLVDHPIDYNRVDGVREGRQGMWFYDDKDERLAVAAEYFNPLQHMVATARALVDPRTFRHVLTADQLEGVFDTPLPILRNVRNVGYLPDRAASPAEFLDEIETAREEFLDLTHELKQAEVSGESDRVRRLRSTILSVAHGLAGIIAHLLDLVDVDLVREVRLPEFSRKHLSDGQFRTDLLRTLSLGAAIQSKYGHYGAYRQLFEPRIDRRRSAFNCTVDAADPFGELIGSFTIVGPNVTTLESDLRSAIRHPADLHEDAPGLAIRVPITDRTDSRAGYAQATRIMCRAKTLGPSRQAVSFLRGLVATPRDAAAALAGLSSETKAPGREIHPDEIRFAISTLQPDRLLPTLPPSVGRIVHALIDAQQPLSQQSLADRAGVSTQSIRNHRDRLQTLDLISFQTPEAGMSYQYRFALPYREERESDAAADSLPWYVVGSPDRPCWTTESDVLFEIAATSLDDSTRLGDPEDPVGGLFFGDHDGIAEALSEPAALPELRPWIPVVEALIDDKWPDDAGPTADYQQAAELDADDSLADTVPSSVEVMGPQPDQHGLTPVASG